jgi:hypothetical protein
MVLPGTILTWGYATGAAERNDPKIVFAPDPKKGLASCRDHEIIILVERGEDFLTFVILPDAGHLLGGQPCNSGCLASLFCLPPD